MSPRESLRAAAREVRSAGVVNTALNALGIVAVAALHLFGELRADHAAGAILILCGAWATVARLRHR